MVRWAQEEEVGVLVTVATWQGVVAARAVRGAGDDVGFFADWERGVYTLLRKLLTTAREGAAVAGAGP